jgi:hypothetical protein
MTHCWSEGALRAYLDRELPSAYIQQAAAHLRDCPACDTLCKALAARAANVAALVDLLPEPEMETIHVPARGPRRAVVRMPAGWVGAAVALAAALGIVAYLVPRRDRVQAPVAVAPVAVAPVAPPAPLTAKPDAVAEVPVVAVRPARNRARQASTRVPEAGDFVALDDEPFESGVIMRVEVKPGNAQADIVFGPDGRPRAFRLVKAAGQKY